MTTFFATDFSCRENLYNQTIMFISTHEINQLTTHYVLQSPRDHLREGDKTVSTSSRRWLLHILTQWHHASWKVLTSKTYYFFLSLLSWQEKITQHGTVAIYVDSYCSSIFMETTRLNNAGSRFTTQNSYFIAVQRLLMQLLGGFRLLSTESSVSLPSLINESCPRESWSKWYRPSEIPISLRRTYLV